MRNDRLIVEVISLDAEDFATKIEQIGYIANSTPEEQLKQQEESEAPPPPPPTRTPWFQVMEGKGKPGDTVKVPVIGGCVFPMDGFHIAGGGGELEDVDRSGYGKLVATGVELAPYLADYLEAQGIGDSYWKKFQFANWDDDKALPSEWWQFGLGFFSLDKRYLAPPIPIPPATELFQITFKVPDNAKPGELVLTCADNRYYTQSVQRRIDVEYTFDPQGFTAVECFPGKFTVE